MNCRLLILGAGIYGAVACEIAESTGKYGQISYIDDQAEVAADGSPVVGRITDVARLAADYSHAVVAIGNPAVRLSLIERIERETACRVISLISPRAYVAPSAAVGRGCVIEPMAVVHTRAVLERGCLISAGAVVNHAAHCREGVHVDCNAIVAGGVHVPAGKKILCGTVYSGSCSETEALR